MAGMQASQGEVEGVLRVTPVFRKLTPHDLHTIAQAASVKRYEKGQVIFEQETPSDAFYTIASGRVKIFKMLPDGEGPHPGDLRSWATPSAPWPPTMAVRFPPVPSRSRTRRAS